MDMSPELPDAAREPHLVDPDSTAQKTDYGRVVPLPSRKSSRTLEQKRDLVFITIFLGLLALLTLLPDLRVFA
jgi:hypothetical protein